ncbi:MAG TPA: hypothetical protein VGG92_22340 [Caulobacteraceae bacterium]|jgi:hypothetical protein
MKSAALIVVVFGSLSLAPSIASAQAAGACPANDMATIRISKIAPGGTMTGFDKAVADHAKWYADHGFDKDRIFAAPMLVADETTHKLAPSPDTMMSFHTHDHEVPKSMEDAAWNAFVAEYRANSVIVSTTHVCLPE